MKNEIIPPITIRQLAQTGREEREEVRRIPG
jgi:hypothetical protein